MTMYELPKFDISEAKSKILKALGKKVVWPNVMPYIILILLAGILVFYSLITFLYFFLLCNG